MKLLIFLLVLVPLSFCVVGPITDYDGETREQNPVYCYEVGRREYRQNIKGHTNETLKKIEKTVKDCISRVALKNEKVAKVQDELSAKLYKMLIIRSVEFPTCNKKLREITKDTECYAKTQMGFDECAKYLGLGGCMIPYQRQYCGDEYLRNLQEMAIFWNKSLHYSCMQEFLKQKFE